MRRDLDDEGPCHPQVEDDGDHLVEIEMWKETPLGVSVGPGPVVVSLPKA